MKEENSEVVVLRYFFLYITHINKPSFCSGICDEIHATTKLKKKQAGAELCQTPLKFS